jgi:hypothetical protein
MGKRHAKDGWTMAPRVWALVAHHQQLEKYMLSSWEAQGLREAKKALLSGQVYVCTDMFGLLYFDTL